MTAPFIHLRVHSAYSLLEGAIGIKDLVKWCVKYKMPAVAVADHSNLFGSLEFAQAAAEAGVQPVMACMLYFAPFSETQNRTGAPRRPEQLLLLAQNETGWKNLMALSSQSFLEPAGEAPLLRYADLWAKSEGLICLTGGMQGTLGGYIATGQHTKAEEFLAQLMQAFPQRLYIELMRHGLSEEQQAEPHFIALALKHNLPLVATNDAYFIEEDMFEAHDAFLCISEGSYVSDETRRRLSANHRLKTPAEMRALFADLPEALENTAAIARRCAVMATSQKPMLPSYTDAAGNTDVERILREEARAGLETRLRHAYPGGVSDEQARPYRERLEFEIDTIVRMQFPGYFLIVSDFIRWSKARGIPVGPGRGSGAGSVVAWALQITDLDPLRYGLLFERFLNPERVSMPDFDVDFCQDRRDEVIAYVQQKYGGARVAQIITFGKLQARAVLRDVGRVLQIPYGQVDRICKLIPNNPAAPVLLEEAIGMEPMLQSAMREDETVQRLVEIALKLEGLNRHASTHAAGVVIADRPLIELVPLYRDPKSSMLVVQYSMKYAESAGLVKFDFLGLKTLTVLEGAARLIRARGISIDLLRLPEGDRKTYDMLARGETMGVFQLEGAGMRDTVKKLRPDRIEDLIALVSLYRPGPMDNIPTYISRKHGQEPPEYLHPLLEPVLKETFGVIIYQEQVMQIAQILAGYSLGEADLLRRAMGKKNRSEMEAQRETFVARAVQRGVEKAQAKEIFDLIAKFAEYGFNKSHAAAYALIAYQTAYIKANFPVEFFAASMTCDMHNTDKLGLFREEAARAGIRMLPPDINRSGVEFTVEGLGIGDSGLGKETSIPNPQSPIPMHIRYALAAIRNVGAGAMQAVVEERERSGAYKNIFDFVERLPAHALGKRGLEFLIKAGAFQTLHPNRAQLMSALDLIVAHGEAAHRDRETAQVNLFGGGIPGGGMQPPALPPTPDWPSLERLHHEFEAIGFYLSAHPMDAYKKHLAAAGVVPCAQFAAKLGERYGPIRAGGIVTGRKFKVSDKGRFAFIQLSDATGVFECSVFNEELLTRHRDKLEVGKVLIISADGKRDESGFRLIAQSISDLEEEMAKRPANNGSLRIVVSNDQAFTPLKTALGEGNGAGLPVTVLAALPGGGRAEIKLPGRYAVTPSQLDRIRVIAGVVEVEEV